MSGAFPDNSRIPVKDTFTGKVYRSKYQAGKALASEFGLDPTDRFVWYKIIKRAHKGRLYY
jgi:hypothetical protein